MTRVFAGMYVVIASAFVAVNAYIGGALTMGDVAGFLGLS